MSKMRLSVLLGCAVCSTVFAISVSTLSLERVIMESETIIAARINSVSLSKTQNYKVCDFKMDYLFSLKGKTNIPGGRLKYRKLVDASLRNSNGESIGYMTGIMETGSGHEFTTKVGDIVFVIMDKKSREIARIEPFSMREEVKRILSQQKDAGAKATNQ